MATANTHINIIITTEEDPDAVERQLYIDASPLQAIMHYIGLIASGVVRGNFIYQIDEADGTQATETYAFTYASGADGDTVTLGNVVFTARTSPSSDPMAGEFALSTDDDTTSAAFAAAVNVHPRIRGILTAANSSGTTTCTMVPGGVFGNLMTSSVSNASFVTLGNSGVFSSGAAGTEQRAPEIDVDSRGLA